MNIFRIIYLIINNIKDEGIINIKQGNVYSLNILSIIDIFIWTYIYKQIRNFYLS